MLAGEASGDAHGARVAREIRRRWPGARLVGLGGEGMAEMGVDLLAGLDELSVMGFAEVVGRLPFFRRLERRIRAVLDRGGIDLVLPIDYPGLNMRIAAHAAGAGIPVLYYIGPQVWAWRAGRARRLARIADRIAVILPFEPECYRVHGGRTRFVGHPLLDQPPGGDAGALGDALGLDPSRPVLALFPGSRLQELERHAKPFTAVALELRRRVPGLQVVVSRVPFLPGSAYRSFPFPATPDPASLRALATVALVKSGTGTLEVALAGVPFAVGYITHPLTHLLARMLVRVSHVALVNLVAGRQVVPEFIQGGFVPDAVADSLEPLLDESSPERQAVLSGLAEVRAGLGTPGAAARVVDLAEELIGPGAGTRSPAVGVGDPDATPERTRRA